MTKSNNITFADIENFEEVEKEMQKIEKIIEDGEDNFEEIIEEDDRLYTHPEYYYTEASLAYYMENYNKPAKVKVEELENRQLKIKFPAGLLPFVYNSQTSFEISMEKFELSLLKKELVDDEKEYYQIINKKLKDHKKYLEKELEKIKIRLNKLAKQGDNIAKLLRLLLELEDINIKAKQTIPYYRDKVYNMKDWHIKEVITFLKEINYDKDYGFKKDTDLDNEAMVFYFDLPGTDEQVSWHTYNNNSIIPEEYLKIEYKKDWIGETEETTYERILESIKKLYSKEIL